MFEEHFPDFTASTGLPVARILAIFSLNSMIDIGFAQQYLLKIAHAFTTEVPASSSIAIFLYHFVLRRSGVL